MDTIPVYDSPESIFRAVQLYDQESLNAIFIFKSAFKELRDAFKKKSPYFKIINSANGSINEKDDNSESESDKQNSTISNEESILPGFPGTQLDSLFYFNQAIEKLNDYSDSLKKLSNSINQFLIQPDAKNDKKQSKKKHRKSKDAIQYDDLNESKAKILVPYNTIMGIKEHLKSISPEKEKKSQKIIKKMDEKITNGHCKPLTAIKLITELTELRANPQRPELLKKMNEFYIHFHECMPNVTKSICLRYSFIKKIIHKFQKRNNKLLSNIEPLISTISQKASEINFEKDFIQFVAYKKIIRYDLKCEAFKPINMSHPVFNNFDPSKIRNVIAVPPVYPIAMAKVLVSFTASDINEITIVKGKMVLLMEPPDYPWVLAMNPFTRQYGYVPSKYLEIVGNALGIITKEVLSDNGINLLVGDYVAILKLKMNKNAPYLTNFPVSKRRKSTLKRSKHNSHCDNLLLESFSNYINETNPTSHEKGDHQNKDEDAESKDEQEKTTNEDEKPNDNLNNNNVVSVEINDEYDVNEEDEEEDEFKKHDDGSTRSVVTVMGEKTKVSFETVGIISD